MDSCSTLLINRSGTQRQWMHPFNIKELLLVDKKTKFRKAGGLDDILSDNVKRAMEVAPDVSLRIINFLLLSHSFSTQRESSRGAHT